jgi:hypothetical protein
VELTATLAPIPTETEALPTSTSPPLLSAQPPVGTETLMPPTAQVEASIVVTKEITATPALESHGLGLPAPMVLPIAAPASTGATKLPPAGVGDMLLTGVGDLLTWAWDGLARLFAWLSETVFTLGPVVKGSLAEIAPLVFDSPIHGQGVGVTTRYALDVVGGLREVAAASSGASTQYLQVQGQILAQYDSGTRGYVAPDALGSVRPVVDPTGSVTLAQSYDPFGSLLTSAGSGGSVLGYTGEQVDADTGLVYFRARYYQSIELRVQLHRDLSCSASPRISSERDITTLLATFLSTLHRILLPPGQAVPVDQQASLERRILLAENKDFGWLVSVSQANPIILPRLLGPLLNSIALH